MSNSKRRLRSYMAQNAVMAAQLYSAAVRFRTAFTAVQLWDAALAFSCHFLCASATAVLNSHYK